MSKKAETPRKKKPFHANKMLANPFKPYTKPELELIINLINTNKEIHVSEILNELVLNFPNCKLTNTQIKKIRFVHFKGDEISKSQMWEFDENGKSKWFISRVKIHNNNRKHGHINFDENLNRY